VSVVVCGGLLAVVDTPSVVGGFFVGLCLLFFINSVSFFCFFYLLFLVLSIGKGAFFLFAEPPTRDLPRTSPVKTSIGLITNNASQSVRTHVPVYDRRVGGISVVSPLPEYLTCGSSFDKRRYHMFVAAFCCRGLGRSESGEFLAEYPSRLL